MQCTILFLILLIVTPLSIAQTATGRVFIDENRNGLLDEGEVGLANVRVSNGASVVLTDATGRYRLAADPTVDVAPRSPWSMLLTRGDLSASVDAGKPGISDHV